MTPQAQIHNLETRNRYLQSALSVISGRMGELSTLVIEFGDDPKIKQHVQARRAEIMKHEKQFIDELKNNNTQIYNLKKELA
nr:MAG TPA: hypothetical protein [Bacteriophage sp.]